MLKTTKSKKRLNLLESICNGITHQEIFETIDYKKQSEDKIKQFTYPILINTLTEFLVLKRGWEDSQRAREFVKANLLWEGNVKTTVHHTHFMGTKNRPDMVLQMDEMNIAIEFKRGDNGRALRSGMGQSLIYSTDYDFVIYLFIDTSDDKKIKLSSNNRKEEVLMKSLWSRYNIKFIVA
ncbi:MAG: hypothetical protein CMP57_03965 [Flavobacteriales bacterium]|nr:hypothetical protein [Flavobacteriales bacterium]|tara:strand:+ start:248 stop:787 length:540 start_codon:yes stop_codon:yes gene_type:complete